MSTVYSQSTAELHPWIRKELDLDGTPGRGASGTAVRRVQEWLTLHGHPVEIDGSFGPATQNALTGFQRAAGLAASAIADDSTWNALVRPMKDALRQQIHDRRGFGAATLVYAQAHLKAHPREVGGPNCGPWVRLYMQGNQGSWAAWCAAFASFLLRQAADSMNTPSPIEGSFSCDTLAAQARTANLFLPDTKATPARVKPGSLFLVRQGTGDWTHAGVVVASAASTFSTIEGNTNDDGDREGYEVCARTRSYSKKDFVLI